MTTSATSTTTMRRSTLETLGLGSALDMFRRGDLPTDRASAVDKVFGPPGDRGSMVISGANGIVGAGKTMQFASRLSDYDVNIVALDFPNAPDGLGSQYQGLEAAFGATRAAEIMGRVVRMVYDGKSLPAELAGFKPRFLLEAIPEILGVKRDHYELFRTAFPDIEIRSVTSGFPAKELGVGVAHPAFPHQINKVFEVVEDQPSDFTRLLWALGLIPMEVSDDWSFVLDVVFCGVTLAAIRYHHARNMPYWKIDKYVRRLLGPNPFRAHDAIGAKGANFLTWSCLHHLGQEYGDLFTPAPDLVERKNSGQNWYPPNHFRPLVDWSLEDDDEEEFDAWILGPMFQMASLMVHEQRSHLAQINIIGELCAQFRSGILAVMRRYGADAVKATVERYHLLYPEAEGGPWHPDTLEQLDSPEWQQLYVNAEHDGDVGVITLGREAYNYDVDTELNRAIDWLNGAGIDSVILTGDFHLTTQLVGAETAEFYPALEDEEAGTKVSRDWSRTARRLANEFETSVGVVNGKRCLGGMLELMLHCDYLVAEQSASLGFPEVTLPVVPGMEGCHWPFRKAQASDRNKITQMLLSGRPVRARDAVGWLIDAAGTIQEILETAWKIARGAEPGIERRAVESDKIGEVPGEVGGLEAGSPQTEAARRAIMECVTAACSVGLDEALDVQSRHSAGFMVGDACRRGTVGTEYQKTVKV